MQNRIEIPFSKVKPSLVVIAGLAFILGGYEMILHPYSDWYRMRNSDPLVFYFLGVASILLGLGGIASGLKIFFSKGMALIIDSNGITDNSSNLSVGLIKWTDITDIRSDNDNSTKFLYIFVKNPEKYIQKKKFTRRLMRMNMGMTGTPLYISSISLKCSFKELERIVFKEFDRYKNVS